jgi:hypothetical protein
MSVSDASIDCDNDLKTFSQHSGECWNDSIQNFLLVSSGIGKQVRRVLKPATAVETFNAWLRSEPIQSWIVENFHTKPDTLPVINRMISTYIDCFKQRIDNWYIHRRTGFTNARGRRASCVLSLCSASAAMYASELLWPLDDPERGFNSSITKEVWNKLQNGSIDPLRNSKMNIEAERLNREFNIWAASRLIRLLLYYFLKADYYKKTSTLEGRNLSSLKDEMLLISESNLTIEDIKTIYQVMKKSHSINLLLSVQSYFIEDAFHQIHLVSCDTNSRNQYIYDNEHAIQKVRWAKVFEPDSKSYYLGWYEYEMDPQILESLLVQFYSGQAFVAIGKRTSEQIRDMILKESRRDNYTPAMRRRLSYLGYVMKDIDLGEDIEKKIEFFEKIQINIKKSAADIRQELLQFVKDNYDDSLIIKTFREFKPILIVVTEEKYYFFNSTGYLLLSDEQLKSDNLFVATLLFCYYDINICLNLIAATCSNIYNYFSLHNAELVWMTPSHVKNVSFNRATLKNNKNKNKTRRRY